MTETPRRVWPWIAATVLGLLLVAGVAIGSHPLSPATVFQALFRYDPAVDDHLLVGLLRLPRTLLALVAGASLGAAGCLMQALTRNSLADPGLLGINAGAAVAVSTGIVLFGLEELTHYIWYAFGGAAAAGFLVYSLGGAIGRGTDTVRLVLAGVACSVVLGAITSILVINHPRAFDDYRSWMSGSLQGRGWEVLVQTLPFILAALPLAFWLAPSLNAMALGPEHATALGVSQGRTTTLILLTVVVLAGSATAAAGPLSFVGLAAPHAARYFVGNELRRLLPASALTAAAFLLAADILGRLVLFPAEAPAGVVATVLGGPVLLTLIRRRTIV